MHRHSKSLIVVKINVNVVKDRRFLEDFRKHDHVVLKCNADQFYDYMETV